MHYHLLGQSLDKALFSPSGEGAGASGDADEGTIGGGGRDFKLNLFVVSPCN